jgi:hypothetical protein
MIKIADVAFLSIANRVLNRSTITFMHKPDGVHMFVKQSHIRFTNDEWELIIAEMQHIDRGTGSNAESGGFTPVLRKTGK